VEFRANGWATLRNVCGIIPYFASALASSNKPRSSGIVYVTATTMTLAGIVACQVGTAFACRSSHQAS
jgi:hypothetical protein